MLLPSSVAANVRGLGEGRLSFLNFRPSRTTKIDLFNGEANAMQAFAKPMLAASLHRFEYERISKHLAMGNLSSMSIQ
jgi:hypothetical protein